LKTLVQQQHDELVQLAQRRDEIIKEADERINRIETLREEWNAENSKSEPTD